MSEAAGHLGVTAEHIKFRLHGKMAYLADRNHQQAEWEKLVDERRLLVEGDHVLLPIPRTDRGNLCPKNGS